MLLAAQEPRMIRDRRLCCAARWQELACHPPKRGAWRCTEQGRRWATPLRSGQHVLFCAVTRQQVRGVCSEGSQAPGPAVIGVRCQTLRARHERIQMASLQHMHHWSSPAPSHISGTRKPLPARSGPHVRCCVCDTACAPQCATCAYSTRTWLQRCSQTAASAWPPRVPRRQRASLLLAPATACLASAHLLSRAQMRTLCLASALWGPAMTCRRRWPCTGAGSVSGHCLCHCGCCGAARRPSLPLKWCLMSHWTRRRSRLSCATRRVRRACALRLHVDTRFLGCEFVLARRRVAATNMSSRLWVLSCYGVRAVKSKRNFLAGGSADVSALAYVTDIALSGAPRVMHRTPISVGLRCPNSRSRLHVRAVTGQEPCDYACDGNA